MGDNERKIARRRRCKIGPPTVRFTVREFVNRKRRKQDAKWPRPRQIESKKEAERMGPPWIYVFSLEKWGSQLRHEARLDGEDEFAGVTWSRERAWQGKDERSPTKQVVSELTVCGGNYDANSSDGLYVMLSRIQLPRARLQQYMGNGPETKDRVRRRCTRLLLQDGPAVTASSSQSGSVKGMYILYLADPIKIADDTLRGYQAALLRARKWEEQGRLDYTLALSAYEASAMIAKENPDFVYSDDGDKPKFDRIRAGDEAASFLHELGRRTWRIKSAGEQLAADTGSPEYEEAMRDFSELVWLLEERVRIEARHAMGKLASQPTRDQMLAQIREPSSRINGLLDSDTSFQAVRKSLTLVAEFGDIMAEYGPIIIQYAEVYPDRSELARLFADAVFNWNQVPVAKYVKRSPISTKGILKIDVAAVKNDPSFRNLAAAGAAKLLVVIEIVNLFYSAEAFLKSRSAGLADYADVIGGLMDTASSVGAAVEASWKARDWHLTQQALKMDLATVTAADVYTNVTKLPRLGILLSGVSAAGSVCDMIVSGSKGQAAADSGNVGAFFGYVTMFTGQTLGLGAALGLLPGGVFWIGVALVLLGIAIVAYFRESPLQIWLRRSPWGRDPRPASKKEQLEDLNRILATFKVSASIASADEVAIRIEPGWVTAKSVYQIEVTGWGRGAWTQETRATADVRTKLDAQGQPQPVTVRVKSRYETVVVVRAQLDLQGDGKSKVPASKPSTWSFRRHPDANVLLIEDVDFPGIT